MTIFNKFLSILCIIITPISLPVEIVVDWIIFKIPVRTIWERYWKEIKFSWER